MSVTVIIPARWGSTRFPGKPLARIAGYHEPGNTEDPAEPREKALIHRTWEVAKASGLSTYVATDHHGVAEHMEARGASVIITPDYLKNGTERCAYAAAVLALRERDVVINLQGDACLTPPEWLNDIASRFNDATSEGFDMRVATIVADFTEPPNHDDVVAFSNILGYAHRFERFKGGYVPDAYLLRHFGVYGYRVRELRDYMAASNEPSALVLEEMDSLEQQRWFHLGTPIKLAWRLPDGTRIPACEVNVPADIHRVEEELVKWQIR